MNQIINFVKDQKVNLGLLGMALVLSTAFKAGASFLEYAVLIKIGIIGLMFVLCKCVYIIVTQNN